MARTNGMAENSPIACVGKYLPRHCGIATFTHDLCEAVALEDNDRHGVFTVAMNDIPEGYNYSKRVRFEVRQSVLADYRLAAEFLNINQVKAVCLQHEYGIFGGACGSHLMTLLKNLRRPLVTTLHTVLKDPSPEQLLTLQEVARQSDRLVVMSDMAHSMLKDIYNAPAEKIVTIPHGIPDVPFLDPNYHKDQFGVEGKKVMLTFGLLSPGKGIEYVIEALPEVVAKHPDLVYIVLGATHPHIKRENGEEYRNSLKRRVSDLGLSNNVIWQNRFVELKELCEFLGAADLYITPYLNEAQITSGTLAYAMGAGKATISTPYWYAKEMLADGRGRLVPFRDSQAITEEILDLLDNETERHAMRKRSYIHCRQMVWKKVAQDYLNLFDEAKEARLQRQRTSVTVAKPAEKQDELPEIDLRHLRTLTDDTGIFQHSLWSTPDRNHGYCIDDNTRALITTVMHWNQNHDTSVLGLIQTYLSFMAYALDEKTGRFKNFMAYDRNWSEMVGSEDSHGRAMWGLGMTVAMGPHDGNVALATKLFSHGLAVTEHFSSPRAWAFVIVGIHAYLRRFGGDSDAKRYRAILTEKLVSHFHNNMTDDWPWCEDVVTYANAKLPHALLMSGKWMQQDDIIDLGKRTLQWLLDIQTSENGRLTIIGTNGWSHKDGTRACFDQQPIEAHALVDACVEAYHVTREVHWIHQARKAFNWFLGENDLRLAIHDFTTGGCRDGLHSDRVNENQGAESTLAWLMSLLLMHDLQVEQTLNELPADKMTKQKPKTKAAKPSSSVVGG